MSVIAQSFELEGDTVLIFVIGSNGRLSMSEQRMSGTQTVSHDVGEYSLATWHRVTLGFDTMTTGQLSCVLDEDRASTFTQTYDLGPPIAGRVGIVYAAASEAYQVRVDDVVFE